MKPTAMIKRSVVATLMILAFGLVSPKTPADAYTYELIVHGSDLVKNGREALLDGELDKALGYFNAVLENGPSQRQEAAVHADMCVAFYLMRSFPEALEHCNTSISLRPNVWLGYNNRGNVYFEWGQFEKARENYERGLRLSPKSTILLRNLSLVDKRLENPVKEQ